MYKRQRDNLSMKLASERPPPKNACALNAPPAVDESPSPSHPHTLIAVPLRASLLGFETSFKHLDGHTVTLKRTSVTKPNQVIRIKGEGMPKHGTPSEFGDLVIAFTVDFPTQVRPIACMHIACAALHAPHTILTYSPTHLLTHSPTFLPTAAWQVDATLAKGLEDLLPAFTAADMRIGG